MTYETFGSVEVRGLLQKSEEVFLNSVLTLHKPAIRLVVHLQTFNLAYVYTGQ